MLHRMRIGFRQGPEEGQGPKEDPTADGPAGDVAAFEPSLADVLIVKALLQRAQTGHSLPLELVDAIIDLAEYWPHSTTAVDYLAEQGRPLVVTSQGGKTGRALVLRTPPIGLFRPPPIELPAPPPGKTYTTVAPVPRVLGDDERDCPPDAGRHWISALSEGADEKKDTKPDAVAWPALTNPCRKIVFYLKSQDQGWATASVTRGAYEGSYSWFDVGLERFCEKTEKTEQAPAQTGDDDSPSTPTTVPTFDALRSIIPPVRLVEHPNSGSITPYPGNDRIVRLPRPPSPTLTPAPPPTSADGDVKYPQTERIVDYVPEFDLPTIEMPGPDRLQTNRVAVRQLTEHTVVWSWTDPDRRRVPQPAEASTDASADADVQDDAADPDTPDDVKALKLQGRGAATGDGSFVRQLLAGDIVTIWAKAVFPGWHNDVAKVAVKVYWAV